MKTPRIDEILNVIRTHPDGATIFDIIDLSVFPSWERETVRHNCNNKLWKLQKQGYIRKVTHGKRGEPAIWRAI